MFGSIAAFGIGNTVQTNSVANALESNFGVSPMVTGIILMVLVGLVLMGGVKRIGDVAGKLVPMMAAFYIGCGGVVLIIECRRITSCFRFNL